jgi:rSAM/selenodomain-associated transferase 1
VPQICVLDPDGDLLRALNTSGQARKCQDWACYHTVMHEFTHAGMVFGIIGNAVGAAFAVLLAEQAFASGCDLLISITSAGQIAAAAAAQATAAQAAAAPYFVLIDRALRDEGTSYHYLPPSRYAAADPALVATVALALAGGPVPVMTGASWTTDAPFRETATAIAAARAEGILAVEMEAAALYAFAQANGRKILCFAQITNQLGQIAGVSKKARRMARRPHSGCWRSRRARRCGAAPMSKSATCAIAVMAKAPQAGRCKTRLSPPLSPEQAAGLSAAFLRDITENILRAGTGIHGCIAYAPAGLESLFDGHLAPGTGLVLADGSPDMPAGIEGFGRCLYHAIDSLLAAGFCSAVVLNSDSPTLPAEFLARTAAILAQPGDRAVLGPADDGGYYLLGMKAPHAHLFAGIAWSTADVAAQTRARARDIGLELVELPYWYDVDDAASLARLVDDLATGAQAPATAACLDRIGIFSPAKQTA